MKGFIKEVEKELEKERCRAYKKLEKVKIKKMGDWVWKI